MTEPAPLCPHHARIKQCPNPAAAPHQCPYLVEIDEDRETLCTCCKDCERECADDI